MVRFKERYLLVNILYPEAGSSTPQPKGNVPDLLVYNQPTADNLTPQALLKGIRARVALLFGDFGSGAISNLQVKYLSHATSTFILRIARAHYRLVWAALTFMDKLPTNNGKPCVFRVVRVSGTIRKVEEEAIRRAKMLMLAAEEEAAGRNSHALDNLFGRKATDMDVTMVSADDESGQSDDADGAEAG